MSSSIIIFSLNGCLHCKNLKNRLTELTIPFIDVEIGENQKFPSALIVPGFAFIKEWAK